MYASVNAFVHMFVFYVHTSTNIKLEAFDVVFSLLSRNCSKGFLFNTLNTFSQYYVVLTTTIILNMFWKRDGVSVCVCMRALRRLRRQFGV